MPPVFFATPAAWRRWLATHHARDSELWVGFYKRESGTPSITWPESVDEALCFGWIDGVRKSLGASAYMIRFTPRRTGSTWSAVNVRRVAELIATGRMEPAGLRAYEARTTQNTAIYAYEQARHTARLPPAYEKEFKKEAAAWRFYREMPAWYQRTSSWWVISAKREETRRKRLAVLMKNSADRKTIAALRRPARS